MLSDDWCSNYTIPCTLVLICMATRDSLVCTVTRESPAFDVAFLGVDTKDHSTCANDEHRTHMYYDYCICMYDDHRTSMYYGRR